MNYQELLDGIEKYYKDHKTDFEYLSDDEKIKIENLFGKVYISKGVVKAVWSLCYINILHCATFMNGVKPNTPVINPNSNPYVYRIVLERRSQIERFFITTKENAGLNGLPEVDFDTIGEIINPSYQPYIASAKYYVINQVCSYALFFLLLHEFAHNVCPIQMPERSEWGCATSTDEEKKKSREIETWCDKEAFERYKKIFLEKFDSKSELYENAEVGFQFAMLYLVVRSLDQHSFDGDEHPEVYNRIWDVMEPISQDDDKFWCILFSVLSFEFKDIDSIKISRIKSYKTFKAVVEEYLQLIKEYDVNECKTKSFKKKKTLYGADFGVKRTSYYDITAFFENVIKFHLNEYWYPDVYPLC